MGFRAYLKFSGRLKRGCRGYAGVQGFRFKAEALQLTRLRRGSGWRVGKETGCSF